MSKSVGGVRIETAILDKMTAEAKPKAIKIVRQYGFIIAGNASERAPYDTGNLKNKILATSKMIEEMVFRIQDGTDYGIFLELGHITRQIAGNYNVRRFIAARPFMFPALEAYRQRFINAFSELFK
jgi:hypothetical protein